MQHAGQPPMASLYPQAMVASHPPSMQTAAFAAAQSSQAARDQALRAKVTSLLSSTANGCIAEVGYVNLCERYKILQGHCDKITKDHKTLTERYGKMYNDYEKLYHLSENAQVTQTELEKVRIELQNETARTRQVESTLGPLQFRAHQLEAENESLRKENHLLREREKLSADEQYSLLQTKYKWVLQKLARTITPDIRQPSDAVTRSAGQASSLKIGYSQPSQRRVSEPSLPSTMQNAFHSEFSNTSRRSSPLVGSIMQRRTPHSPSGSRSSTQVERDPRSIPSLSPIESIPPREAPSIPLYLQIETTAIHSNLSGAGIPNTPLIHPGSSTDASSLSNEQTLASTSLPHNSPPTLAIPRTSNEAVISDETERTAVDNVSVSAGGASEELPISADMALDTHDKSVDDPDMMDFDQEINAMDVTAVEALVTSEVGASEIDRDVSVVEGSEHPQEANLQQVEEEEEEPEEDVGDITDDELPDGTNKISVLDCLGHLFFDDDEDVRRCQGCIVLASKGLLHEDVKTFSESSLQDLVQHAKSHHPRMWSCLRLGTTDETGP